MRSFFILGCVVLTCCGDSKSSIHPDESDAASVSGADGGEGDAAPGASEGDASDTPDGGTKPCAEFSVLTSTQFTTLNEPGWGFGAQAGGNVRISTDPAQNHNDGATAIVGSYPASGNGESYVWGGYDVSSLGLSDVYIDFWAKMPGAKQGLKFLKIFGRHGADDSYSNTTFGLDYTGIDLGGMAAVSFGDGANPQNDTQNIIILNGDYPNWIGRSYGKATVSTPQNSIWQSSNWGTSWHHFRMHVKFNSGTTAATEVNDGEYYLEIDGKVYADAKGLFNRHYSNGPIDSVAIFNWAQSGKLPFEIWYSDMTISTGCFASSTP
jgi:hypothetical protein